MGKTTMDRRWLPLNALRAFEGVAKHLSFTAAANALLISQSALSRHVIALEKMIGVQLFERRPHSLVLTKAGQHLLPAVMKSFDRLEYALDDLRNDGATGTRTLRVQMPPSFAAYLAVPILRAFRRAACRQDPGAVRGGERTGACAHLRTAAAPSLEAIRAGRQFTQPQCGARSGFRYRDVGRAICVERRGRRAARHV